MPPVKEPHEWKNATNPLTGDASRVRSHGGRGDYGEKTKIELAPRTLPSESHAEPYPLRVTNYPSPGLWHFSTSGICGIVTV